MGRHQGPEGGMPRIASRARPLTPSVWRHVPRIDRLACATMERRALSRTSSRCAPCRRGQGSGRLHHNPSLLLEVMKLRHARLEQVGDIIPIPASQGAGMTVDYLAIAEHRLEKSRRVLERQRELIANAARRGNPRHTQRRCLRRLNEPMPPSSAAFSGL